MIILGDYNTCHITFELSVDCLVNIQLANKKHLGSMGFHNLYCNGALNFFDRFKSKNVYKNLYKHNFDCLHSLYIYIIS